MHEKNNAFVLGLLLVICMQLVLSLFSMGFMFVVVRDSVLPISETVDSLNTLDKALYAYNLAYLQNNENTQVLAEDVNHWRDVFVHNSQSILPTSRIDRIQSQLTILTSGQLAHSEFTEQVEVMHGSLRVLNSNLQNLRQERVSYTFSLGLLFASLQLIFGIIVLLGFLAVLRYYRKKVTTPLQELLSGNEKSLGAAHPMIRQLYADLHKDKTCPAPEPAKIDTEVDDKVQRLYRLQLKIITNFLKNPKKYAALTKSFTNENDEKKVASFISDHYGEDVPK